MTAVVGRLLKEKLYLVVKNYGVRDVCHRAPAGAAVVWLGGTYTSRRLDVGDVLLHTVILPHYRSFSIGAIPGEDFEWVDQTSEYAIDAAAHELFDSEGVEIWMHNKSPYLNGRTPIEAADQGDGQAVRNLIDALAEGVPL